MRVAEGPGKRPVAAETVELLWEIFDPDAEEFAAATWGRWFSSVADIESWARRNLVDATVNFVSVPWCRIAQLYRRELDGEAVIRRCRGKFGRIALTDVARAVAGRANVTVLQLERVFPTLVHHLRLLHIRTVLMPGGRGEDREMLQRHGIDAITMPYIPPRAPPAPRAKDILVSFIGGESEESAGTRRLIKERFTDDAHFVVRESHFWRQTLQGRSQDSDAMETHYDEILARSRFALCPGGFSPQTVRFYEALSAGAIPVVIADGWSAPEWDWPATCVVMSAAEFETRCRSRDSFERYLLSFSARESLMRARCLEAWRRFEPCALPGWIVDVMRNHAATSSRQAFSDGCPAFAVFDGLIRRDWASEAANVAEPATIRLDPAREERLMATLAKSETVAAACAAVGVDRSYWEALLDAFPDFRARVRALASARGSRPWG